MGNDLKNRILRALESLGGERVSYARLAEKVRVRGGNDRRVLTTALRELQGAGKLIYASGYVKLLTDESRLFRGVLRGNRRGFAFLLRDDGGEDLFIPHRALNGALHGDTVTVRKTGDSEGAVVSILSRGVHKLVGTYVRTEGRGYVLPDDDNYFKDLYIPDEKDRRIPNNTKVVASVNPEDVTGKIIETLGKAGERNAEVLSILRTYEFSESFPESVILAAQRIKYYEDTDRTDYRGLLTITIDGDDAKDFDDAISLEVNPSGYVLYVHIADVTHFVKPGDPLDKEAFLRGTSVYFPGSVFPMLPEVLSNGLCSLNPHEDKLTLTAVLTLNKDGVLTGSDFKRSVICSNYRMTYKNVTKILEGDPALRADYAEIVPMLEASKTLAALLDNRRKAEGAIQFVTKETQVVLDENGKVTDLLPYPYEISNGIIEQFMILANEAVAVFMTEAACPGVFRVHQPPAEKKMEDFLTFIRALGYDMNLYGGVRPAAFAALLEEVKDSPLAPVISKVMLKSMQKASYAPENGGHFGLSLTHYCHFTSPIRRYPDLMLHRTLKTLLLGKADGAFKEKYRMLTAEAAARSSERERAAERAERDIDDYYKAAYMADKVGERFTGIVSGVLSTGMFVALENTVEGYLDLDDLPADRYDADTRNYKMSGTRYQFAVGDAVEVEVTSVSLEARRVYFRFVGDIKNHLRKKSYASSKKL